MGLLYRRGGHDLLLPDASGIAVGRALRDAASPHDVPIVIISGDRTVLARSTLEISADSFLEKPQPRRGAIRRPRRPRAAHRYAGRGLSRRMAGHRRGAITRTARARDAALALAAGRPLTR